MKLLAAFTARRLEILDISSNEFISKFANLRLRCHCAGTAICMSVYVK